MRECFFNAFVVLLMLVSIFSFGCQLSPAAKEEFVLPDHFTGAVVVFFGIPDGVEPDFLDGSVVYRIPSEGVLKVRTPPTHRSAGTVYRFMSDKNAIAYVDHWGQDRKSFDNLSEDERKNGTLVFNDGGLGSFNVKGRTIQYRGFLVGNPQNRARMYDSLLNKVFEFQRQLTSNN